MKEMWPIFAVMLLIAGSLVAAIYFARTHDIEWREIKRAELELKRIELQQQTTGTVAKP